jgi:hypothetical protein
VKHDGIGIGTCVKNVLMYGIKISRAAARLLAGIFIIKPTRKFEKAVL